MIVGMIISLVPAATAQQKVIQTGFVVSPAEAAAKHFADVTPLQFGASQRPELPKVFRVPGQLPPAIMQTGNSCVAMALSYGLASYLRRIPTSGDYTYRIALEQKVPIYRKQDLITFDDNNSDSLPPGLNPPQAMATIKDKGVCDLDQYRDWRYKIPPELRLKTVNNSLVLNNKVLDPRGIVERIKSTMHSSGNPVPFGMAIDDAFRTRGYRGHDAPGKPVVCRRMDSPDAMHFMLITGWDNTKNAFEVLNSFGSDFANNGYVWIDYEVFRSDYFIVAYSPEKVKDPNKVEVTTEMKEAFTSGEEIDAYCKLGVQLDRNGRFQELSFDVNPPDVSSGNLEIDQVITATEDVEVRAASPTRISTGLVWPEPPLGWIKKGEKVKLVDLTAFRVDPTGVRGTATNYWIKVQRIPQN